MKNKAITENIIRKQATKEYSQGSTPSNKTEVLTESMKNVDLGN